jgi:hypothetical protein
MKNLLLFLVLIITDFPLSQGSNISILNGIPTNHFLVYLAWGLIGLLFNKIIEFVGRSSKNKSKFSITYWWKDNRAKIILSIIALPIAIILSNSLIGMDLSITNSFLIGGAIDRFIVVMKKRIDNLTSSND